MVGIWEFQLNNLNKDNIPLYEKFFEEGMVPERRRTQTAGFRVIPIEKEIQDSSEVQPYEKVSEIIESSHRFAVADCICRKEARIMGHGCDKLLEACMSFDLAADYYIENGLGREISKKEAQEILLKAEESGLVHHSSNHKGGKMFICNCCGCCCKAMAHINKYNNLTAIAHSNYYALVDSETCIPCEACVERCQVNAIQMEDDVSVHHQGSVHWVRVVRLHLSHRIDHHGPQTTRRSVGHFRESLRLLQTAPRKGIKYIHLNNV